MNIPEPDEKGVLHELWNIIHSYPLWPGSTLSHATANECVRRGWAERNKQGDFLPTQEGIRIGGVKS